MNKAETTLPKLLLLGVAAASLAIGVSGAASASTDTTEPTGTEPTGTEPAHTEAGHTMDTTAPPPASLAVDGSAEASSPEAEAFCTAELNVEAAFNSGDSDAIGPAMEALTAAAPADIADTVGAVLANVENSDSPEFAEAYGAMIDYMKANCGFAEVDVVASEFTFEGVPSEIPAGPAIISLENAGEQVHEFAVMRLNDDVTLTAEEIQALPQEEVETIGPPVAFAFTFRGSLVFGFG
jgi:hypothetical protein